MESFATPYPVLFYDGEQELDKGHVGVHSVLSFKRFQALMAQKTGIPAHQLSAVFVCRRTLKDTEKRQKLPINENTNFNIILNQHNPSRERDCHFLVSIKKSKKERKGTRKRSAEAENAEDDDSTSSRGDVSPSDERPKLGSAEGTFSPEATSPRNFLRRPSSPTITPPSNGNGQRINNRSPNGKLAAEYKVERTFPFREGAGHNGFASPSSGWEAGAMSQRVEGFSVPNSASGKVDKYLSQSQNGSAVLQEDRRDVQRVWRQSSPVHDENGTVRQTDKANVHTGGQSQVNYSPLDVVHQDRFNDAMSQRHGIRPPSGAAVTSWENGAQVSCSSALHRSSSMSSSSNNARPSMPSITCATPGPAFIPRVSIGSLAAVAATNGGVTLQQAHISHLQPQHHSPLVGTMSQLELSQLNGMLRGLVARDNRGENAKICKFCYFLRERNIGPPPFHWCVDDTITKGFRGPSPAGPIGRPVKRHVEAAA